MSNTEKRSDMCVCGHPREQHPGQWVQVGPFDDDRWVEKCEICPCPSFRPAPEKQVKVDAWRNPDGSISYADTEGAIGAGKYKIYAHDIKSIPAPEMCECGHSISEHMNGVGKCTHIENIIHGDCTCPSFRPATEKPEHCEMCDGHIGCAGREKDCQCHRPASEPKETVLYCHWGGCQMPVVKYQPFCAVHSIEVNHPNAPAPPPQGKIEKLDVITGFKEFPEGSIYDVPRLAAKINEIIDHLNGN